MDVPDAPEPSPEPAPEPVLHAADPGAGDVAPFHERLGATRDRAMPWRNRT